MLYEILGLPPRKLATKEAIRRAYRLMSLRYHPDKVSPEEAEEAADKFLAIKTAYDLLMEGAETGGVGMGGAVPLCDGTHQPWALPRDPNAHEPWSPSDHKGPLLIIAWQTCIHTHTCILVLTSPGAHLIII